MATCNVKCCTFCAVYIVSFQFAFIPIHYTYNADVTLKDFLGFACTVDHTTHSNTTVILEIDSNPPFCIVCFML